MIFWVYRLYFPPKCGLLELNRLGEDFLQFIWKFQLFDKTDLKTIDGQSIKVIQTGIQNSNAGPDFLESKVVIGEIEWCGSVEVHQNSSDWYLHRHDQDERYENVILHVVWKTDQEVLRQDGSLLPALNLEPLVDKKLINNYLKVMQGSHEDYLPCYPFLPKVTKVTKAYMVDKCLVERMEQKISRLFPASDARSLDWEEVSFRLLLKGFGFKVNEEAFWAIGDRIRFPTLRKYIDDLVSLEALLFGTGGFLNKIQDEYTQQLSERYEYLKQKHQLEEIIHKWRFLRLRPSNFPTLRLAQLAAVLYKSPELFNRMVNIKEINELDSFFTHPVSSYWHTHYDFGKENQEFVHSVIGKESVMNLAINVVAPLKIIYGKWRHEEDKIEEAISLLEKIPAEKNQYIQRMKKNGFDCKKASHSQGLLHLHHNYCEKKRCLHCMIGKQVISSNAYANN